jgi:hypothetical protein
MCVYACVVDAGCKQALQRCGLPQNTQTAPAGLFAGGQGTEAQGRAFAGLGLDAGLAPGNETDNSAVVLCVAVVFAVALCLRLCASAADELNNQATQMPLQNSAALRLTVQH